MIMMEYVNKSSDSDLNPAWWGRVYENRFHQYNDRYTITGSPRYTNIYS